MSGHTVAGASLDPVRDPALDHQAGRRRVFIVHLRLDADPAHGRLSGRIEHVQSSDAAHFETTDELVAFISGHVTPVSK